MKSSEPHQNFQKPAASLSWAKFCTFLATFSFLKYISWDSSFKGLPPFFPSFSPVAFASHAVLPSAVGGKVPASSKGEAGRREVGGSRGAGGRGRGRPEEGDPPSVLAEQVAGTGGESRTPAHHSSTQGKSFSFHLHVPPQVPCW
jgi:hypothetical protein